MGKKKHILIVEDVEANRMLLKKILSSEYEIHEAVNGEEGLQRLHTYGNVIEAIVLDILMPVMDGFTFLEIIKQDMQFKNIPVVVVTELDTKGFEEQALAKGAHDFIQKPYSPILIKQCLHNAIALQESQYDRQVLEKDTLTGLYNRETFYLEARKFIERDYTLCYAIAVFDIDNFRTINDIFGQLQGDVLLGYIADVLRREYRNTGTVIGRLDADHFAICNAYKHRFSTERIDNVLYKIRKFPIHYQIMARCGIYFTDDDDVAIAVMCERAHMAIRSIKGVSTQMIAFYADNFRLKLTEEQEISSEMHQALLQRQFQVFYQGKYDLGTGKMIGAEALSRWNHPEKGMLTPDRFITVFEKNGFITNLDLFVIEECCRFLKDWMDAGNVPVPISINVSKVDLYNPNFRRELINIVERNGIPVKFLELEITETTYSENSEQIIPIIKSLRKYGFSIEMDDFGSGFSSINMLCDVPFDVIKLDMNYLKYREKYRSNNVISFIASLAKWLGVKVAAEGVETKEDAIFLNSLGCAWGQGYYFSKPLSRAEFEPLVKQFEGAAKEQVTVQKFSPIHLEELWNPESAFNILFSSFVGTVGIYEYVGETLSLLRANNNYFAMFDESSEEIYKASRNMLDHICPDDKEAFVTALQEAIREDGETSIDIKWYEPIKRKEVRWYHILMKIIYHDDQRVIVLATIENITNKKREEEALRITGEAAGKDSLTGLYNRMTIEKIVNASMSKAGNSRSYVFMMLDLDDFKAINDKKGHLFGDEMLIKVAELLRNCFRNEDIVARLGGDEFAVFWENTSDDSIILARASAIKEAFEEYRTTSGNDMLGFSMGIAKSPEHGICFHDLYTKADAALYTAKNSGKRKYKIYEGAERCYDDWITNPQYLLDEMQEAIYVCDKNTHKMLYTNKRMNELFQLGNKECLGKTCYEVLQGAEKPCEGCSINQMTAAGYCTREVYFEKLQKNFRLRGKLIRWKDTWAYMEMAILIEEEGQDNTAERKKSSKVVDYQDSEQVRRANKA